jgi:hypothetical protein
VARYLAAHPQAELSAVTCATGLAKPKIQRTEVWKQHENAALEAYLCHHAEATVSEIHSCFGFAGAKVVKMRAWQEHRARRLAARPPRSIKVRPLPRATLECRSDHAAADPTKRVEDRDCLFQALVKAADEDTRKRLTKLTSPQQAALLEYLLVQVDTQQPEETSSSEALAIMVLAAEAWLEQQEEDGRHQARIERGRSRHCASG